MDPDSTSKQYPSLPPPPKGTATLHDGLHSEVSTYRRSLRALITTWRALSTRTRLGAPLVSQFPLCVNFSMVNHLPWTGSLFFKPEGAPLSNAKVSQAYLDKLLVAFIQSPTQFVGCVTCQSERVFRNGLDLDLSLNIYTRIGLTNSSRTFRNTNELLCP